MATGVDVRTLVLALKRLDKSHDVWKADTYLRDYPQGPFGDTESVILRFPPRTVLQTEQDLKDYTKNVDQHENVDQPIFKDIPEARPIIFNLMGAIQGERLGRCMINKLRPGGRIYAHADTPVHAEYWDRFHVVLQAQPGSNFRCGDETIYMEVGEVWWFNNKIEHEVINNSADDRIHLIIDIRTSKPCEPKKEGKDVNSTSGITEPIPAGDKEDVSPALGRTGAEQG